MFPCVEIGWRLAQSHWGNGYATEGGRAALQVAFDQLNLEEVVSFTAVGNRRSRRVMERLGMGDSTETFEHPAIPPGHQLRQHCLYRISKAAWQVSQ
ncbi:MAG: GNAT family N-acetyltransferase [Candidatus Thiodiazotropha lotti]